MKKLYETCKCCHDVIVHVSLMTQRDSFVFLFVVAVAHFVSGFRTDLNYTRIADRQGLTTLVFQICMFDFILHRIYKVHDGGERDVNECNTEQRESTRHARLDQ